MSTKTQALNVPLAHLDLIEPVVVEEDVPLHRVLEAMRAKERGSVVVTRRGVASGVFTERDYLYKHALENVPPGTAIGTLMSAQPVTVSADTTLGEAVEMMHQKRIRNLPVVDKKGRPAGLLTVGLIIRHLAGHFPAEVVNLPPTLNQVSGDSEGA